MEQAVEIPPSHRLLIDIPPEVPEGRAILTFTVVPANDGLEYAREIWANNSAHPEELKKKLQNLRGSLSKSAFGDMDGVAYQRKVRDEWDD